MKIGFDAKRLYNNYTGLGNYSRTLVHNLNTYFPDNEYILYSPKSPLTPETRYFKEHLQTRTAHGGLLKAAWRSHGIVRDLMDDGVELYHGLSHDLPFGIEKMRNLRKIVTIHDVCYKTYPDMFPWVERKIYDIKYAHACKTADKILAISQSTKADIINRLGVSESKIEVIHQAINPIFYTPAPLDECRKLLRSYDIPKDYILYVGSINSRKNLMGLLRAYTIIPESLRMPLVVIGSGGKYMEQCMKFAQNNNLLKYLIMLSGISSSATLQAFYQCATVMVYPSFYEGFGLPVTEAMLSGTPVITSNISSLPEAGGDAAFYIDPYTVADIASALERVIESESLRKDMVDVGLKFAHDNFSQQGLTAKVVELYKSLL